MEMLGRMGVGPALVPKYHDAWNPLALSNRLLTGSSMSSPEEIKRRIIELEVEHRDLDAVIDTLVRDARHEELQLRRLKKRKLQLKDHIMLLKMQLVPDIPA